MQSQFPIPGLNQRKATAMSVPSTITFQSLANSNMPSETKSAIRRWYDSAQGPGGGNSVALAKLRVKAAGEGLRAGGESLVIGGALGAVHAYLPGGLDYHQVPIDAVAGAIGIAAGAIAAQEEFGKDIANAGAACLAVFAFRKTNDLISEKKISKASFGGESAFKRIPGVSWGKTFFSKGNFGEDPIIAAARNL